MPTRIYNLPWLRRSQEWTPRLDWTRMQTVENQLLGAYAFIGQGVMGGWDVISHDDFSEKDEFLAEEKSLEYITQAEVDGLSATVKSSLAHLDAEMMIKVTAGEGIVGFYPGYTTSEFWFAIPKQYRNAVWYAYVIPTEDTGEAESYLSEVFVTDQFPSYEQEFPGAYLATLIVVYDTDTGEHYIREIEVAEGRRRNITNLEGSNFDSILDAFMRHRHDGKEDSPTQILLTTDETFTADQEQRLSDLFESPVFIMSDNVELQVSLAYGPDILEIGNTLDSQGNEVIGNLEEGLWYYAVTSNIIINGEEEESLSGNVVGFYADNASGNSITISWNRMPGAVSYNVYRTLVANDGSRQLFMLAQARESFEITDNGNIDFVEDDFGNEILLDTTKTTQQVLTVENNDDSDYAIYGGSEETMDINDAGELETTNYVIPGIGQENRVFGTIENEDIQADMGYYRGEVYLNGELLDPNDYNLLIADGANSNATTVFLKNNISENDTLQVVAYVLPNQTQVTDQIRANKLAWINGESIAYGQISKRHITPPDHYGLSRLRESANVKPYTDMRTSDYQRYFVQDHNNLVQYDDDILYIRESINIDDTLATPYLSDDIGNNFGKYVVVTRQGNYVTSNFQHFEEIPGLPADQGLIISTIDNVDGGDSGVIYDNHYEESFVLLNTGKVLYTTDGYRTWTEIPIYPSSNFFATAFEIATERVEEFADDSSKQPDGIDIIDGGDVIITFSRKLHIGGYIVDATGSALGSSGIWSSDIGPGGSLVDASWDLWDIFSGTSSVNVWDIREIITPNIFTNKGDTKRNLDRTIYASTSLGFLINQELFDATLKVRKIHWLHSNFMADPDDVSFLGSEKSEGTLHDILLETIDLTDDTRGQALLVNHDALHKIETSGESTSDYWLHPLSAVATRAWKIFDATEQSRNYITGSGTGQQYYFAGTDISTWYAGERIYTGGLLGPEILATVYVEDTTAGGELLGEIIVEDATAGGEILAEITVTIPEATLTSLSDEDYANARGWKIPSWSLVEGIEDAPGGKAFYPSRDVRAFGEGPPDINDGTGRAGPFAGSKYDDIDNGLDYFDDEENTGAGDDSGSGSGYTGSAGSNNVIMGGFWGLWIGEGNDGSSVERLYYEWPLATIPSIFANDSLLSDSIGLYELEPYKQSILFNGSREIDDIILMEKDFTDYFLSNGGWSDETSDVIIYVNGSVASQTWSIDSRIGQITFDQPLDKTKIVDASIVKRNAYLTNVGNITHFEVDSEYQIDPDKATRLGDSGLDSDPNTRLINVDTTSVFDADLQYVQINNERIHVRILDTSRLEIITPRSNAVDHLGRSTVYQVDIKSLLGIQDYLSMATSHGVTYNMHSTFISNLINLTLSLKHTYADIDGDPSLIPSGWTGNDGHVQARYTIIGTDPIDELNSWITFHRGLMPSKDDEPYQPLFTFCSYVDDGFSILSDGALIGTDHGIWRRENARWKQVDRCTRRYTDGRKQSSSRVYFIKRFRTSSDNAYLWAGTDVGIWISRDDGIIWEQNNIYTQSIYDIDHGYIPWSSGHTDVGFGTSSQDAGSNLNEEDKYYEIYSKEDGMVIVLYQDPDADQGSGLFWSDHVAGDDVYFFNQHDGHSISDRVFIGKDGDLFHATNSTDSTNTVLTVDSIVSESDNLSQTPRERIVINDDGSEETETYFENLKYYQMLLNPNLPYLTSGSIAESRNRGSGIPAVIFLTNDGLRISKQDWLHINANGAISEITWENTPLAGLDINCNCYTVVPGVPESEYGTETGWKFYRMLIGTNKGIYYSFDGGYNWTHLNNKFPNGGTSVYSIRYEDSTGILLAMTDAGVAISYDQGDTWLAGDGYEITSTYYLKDVDRLAQTFVAEDDDIIKASIYVHRKPDTVLKYQPEDYEEYYGTLPIIELSLYSVGIDGMPDTLIETSSTTYYPEEIICDTWLNFEFSSTVSPGTTYALVSRMINAYNLDKDIGWISSNQEDPYADGMALSQNAGLWSENGDGIEDFFFMIHYDSLNVPNIIEKEATYSQDLANNIAVSTTSGSLFLDMRFMFGFIIDGTGSMSWMDPDDNRMTKMRSLIDLLLARADLSYVDIWTMDTELRSLLRFGPTRMAEDIDGAFGRILSTGDNSEIWTGGILATGGVGQNGFDLMLENSLDPWTIISYMDSMQRIDTDALQAMDPGWSGAIEDLLLTQHTRLKDYIIQDFADTYARAIFYASDNFDSASHVDDSWEDLEIAVNSLKFDDAKVPLFAFGIGATNSQSEMMNVGIRTAGRYFMIADDDSKWDDAIQKILNGDRDGSGNITRKDTYLWKGKYEDVIDFGDSVEFIEWIELPAFVPATAEIDFRIRWTKDFITWSPWTDIAPNTQHEMKVFVTMIEYEIILYQGDTVPGDPYGIYDGDYGYNDAISGDYPSPIVGKLRYAVVEPSTNYYMGLVAEEEKSILEYLLSYNAVLPRDARIDWFLGRTSCNNFNIFESIHAGRKGTLPIREGSIFFTPDIVREGLRANPVVTSINAETAIFWSVREDDGSQATWEDGEDVLTILVDGEEVSLESAVTATAGVTGLIEFSNGIPTNALVQVTITTPGGLRLSQGEQTIRLNPTTYQAINGPWPDDAKVIMYIDGIPTTDGFWTLPQEGRIIFKNYVPDEATEVSAKIVLSGNNRIMAKVTNYRDIPYELVEYGINYSTVELEIDYPTEEAIAPTITSANLISIAKNSIQLFETLDEGQFDIIEGIIGNLHSIPFINYEYDHAFKYPEADTQITWYRQRDDGPFIAIPEMQNKLSKPLSWDIYPKGSGQIWEEEDIWKAEITARTQWAESSIWTTNSFQVGDVIANPDIETNAPPVISNVRLFYIKDANYSKRPTVYPTTSNNQVQELPKVTKSGENGTYYEIYYFTPDGYDRIWIKCDINISGIPTANVEATINQVLLNSRVQWFNSKGEVGVSDMDNYNSYDADAELNAIYLNWSLPISLMAEEDEQWHAVITPRITEPSFTTTTTGGGTGGVTGPVFPPGFGDPDVNPPIEIIPPDPGDGSGGGGSTTTQFSGQFYPSEGYGIPIRTLNSIRKRKED